jgi:hypothetical protein
MSEERGQKSDNRGKIIWNAEILEFGLRPIGACAYAPVGSRKGNVLNFVGCLKFLNLESIKPA